jgi:hypothetical protein
VLRSLARAWARSLSALERYPSSQEFAIAWLFQRAGPLQGAPHFALPAPDGRAVRWRAPGHRACLTPSDLRLARPASDRSPVFSLHRKISGGAETTTARLQFRSKFCERRSFWSDIAAFVFSKSALFFRKFSATVCFDVEVVQIWWPVL